MRTAAFLAAVLALTGLVSAGPKQTRITISKETTRITEPLTEDGYPDYLAALNARLSEGVTPENNAAVLLWRVFGPGRIEPEFREKYFRMLGMNPLPEEGEYLDQGTLYDLYDERARDRDCREDLKTAAGRPWTRTEFPLIAAWLARNRAALDLVVEAARREKCWFPLIADGAPEMIAAQKPEMGLMYGRREVMGARIMLRLGSGDADGAMADLLACRRLGRHLAGGTVLIDKMIGVAVDRWAEPGERVLAHEAGLKAETIRAYARRLRALPPFPDMVEAFEIGERWACLDCICSMAGDPELLAEYFGDIDRKVWRSGFDFDVILRMANEYFDRMVEACRRPTLADRLAASKELEVEKPTFGEAFFSAFSTEKRSRFLGNLLIRLFGVLSDRVIEESAKHDLRMELSLLSIALGAHKAEHGTYPEKLEGLVIEVPKDPFTDKSIFYAMEGEGFVLQSAGPDGEFATREEEEDSDDLVIRVP